MAKLSDDILTAKDNINSIMSSLSSLCYDYMQYYDEYEYENLKDASLLKDKLKDAIMKVYNDDIQ